MNGAVTDIHGQPSVSQSNPNSKQDTEGDYDLTPFFENQGDWTSNLVLPSDYLQHMVVNGAMTDSQDQPSFSQSIPTSEQDTGGASLLTDYLDQSESKGRECTIGNMAGLGDPFG